MQLEKNIIKKMRFQIAHIMIKYGHEPDDLIYKLECLVMEWFLKGMEGNTV